MTSKKLKELQDINFRINSYLLHWYQAVNELDKGFSAVAWGILKDSIANIRIALDRADKVCERIYVERGKVK